MQLSNLHRVSELSERTGMTADDIVAALEGLRALVRDPITGAYALRLDYEYFASYVAKWEAKGYVRLNSESLVWTPYIVGRNNLVNFETAPGLATIAPREDAEADAEKLPSGTAPEETVQMQIKDQMAREISESTPAAQSGAVNGTAEPAISSAEQLPATPALTSSTSAPAPVPAPSTPQAIPPTRYELFPPLTSTPKRALASSRRHRTSAPFASLGHRRRTGNGAGGRGTQSTAAAVAASAVARRKRKEEALALAGKGKGGGLGLGMGKGKGRSEERAVVHGRLMRGLRGGGEEEGMENGEHAGVKEGAEGLGVDGGHEEEQGHGGDMRNGITPMGQVEMSGVETAVFGA